MKKILSAVIIAAFCALAVLTACRNAPENSGTSLSSSEAAEAEETVAVSDPEGTGSDGLESDGTESDGTLSETVSGGVSETESSVAEESPSAAESSEPESDNSDPVESATDSRSEPPEQSSEPESEKPGAPEMLYCVYSEKPYFAIIGRCEEGATVHAECNGYSFSSLSWHGWFSVRMKGEGIVGVKMYQTVNGIDGEPKNYMAAPKTPYGDEGVVTGKDFQFFYQKNLPDFLKINVPNQYQLDSFTSRIKSRVETLRSLNPESEIIYMIVPASVTVYPERVPDEYVSPEGESRLDKVIKAIRAGGATAIDLRAAFDEHKNDEMPLYYHLDSHWADYGGYIAYRELFEHISKRFPAAKPRDIDEFDWNPGYYESGDMPMYLSLPYQDIKDYGYYRKFNIEVPSEVTRFPRYRRETSLVYSDFVTYENVINTGRSDLPDCLVYRDSFGTQVYDILAERSGRTHYAGMWSYGWNNATVKSEKPDYVIYIVSEWNIPGIINN